jgi:hypothetical protein
VRVCASGQPRRRVLEDGFAVKATLKGRRRAVRTTAAGVLTLMVFKRHARVVVGAAGWAPASFEVP